MAKDNCVTVTIRLPKQVANDIQKLVRSGSALSRSDYVRTILQPQLKKDLDNIPSDADTIEDTTKTES